MKINAQDNKSFQLNALCVLIGILLSIVSLGFRQGQSKMIEWSKAPLNSKIRTSADIRPLDQIEAIEIEDIVVEGKSVSIGVGFVAGDDWIQSITFPVKNISGQRFEAIQITIVLPEMRTGGPNIVYCYGCAKAEREKGVRPGEKVELKILSGGFYGWVRDKMTAQGSLSRIGKAQIRDMMVVLPDGTQLLSGCVKTADPKNACPHDAPQ